MTPFSRFKRLVVCADGTWNHLIRVHPTNIIKIARAVRRVGADSLPYTFVDPEHVQRSDGGYDAFA